ncbi:hypothetical protein AB0H41_35135 [Streptomyces wuyuanensis]
MPRDRDGSFEPEGRREAAEAPDGRRRDDHLAGREGLDHREAQAHLAEVYGAEVSGQTISNLTDRHVGTLSGSIGLRKRHALSSLDQAIRRCTLR